MKLKLWLCFALIALMTNSAWATTNSGLYYINIRGTVNCGTQKNTRILAYKEKDKWQGMDVELCKMLSTAIFGKSDRFKMVPLANNQISKALKTNKIDVMIGGLPYSATTEISTHAMPVDSWYYDRQVFLAHQIKDAKSMEAYKGQKVCVVNNSNDLVKLKAYNNKYQLDFSLLPFASIDKAKEAFLLRRCQLLTGNFLLLKDIVIHSPTGVSDVELLPETITVRPIFVFTDKNNTTLRSIVKWTINAVKQAEETELNSKNVDINLSSSDPSTRNLLGLDDRLWKRFKLVPQWLQTFLKESGNYGEIFENNLGQNSQFQIQRNENNLLKNNGKMTSYPFI